MASGIESLGYCIEVSKVSGSEFEQGSLLLAPDANSTLPGANASGNPNSSESEGCAVTTTIRCRKYTARRSVSDGQGCSEKWEIDWDSRTRRYRSNYPHRTASYSSISSYFWTSSIELAQCLTSLSEWTRSVAARGRQDTLKAEHGCVLNDPSCEYRSSEAQGKECTWTV